MEVNLCNVDIECGSRYARAWICTWIFSALAWAMVTVGKQDLIMQWFQWTQPRSLSSFCLFEFCIFSIPRITVGMRKKGPRKNGPQKNSPLGKKSPKNGPRRNGPRKNFLKKFFPVKRMLGNLNDFFIFIDWFHFTHENMFDVHLTILHAWNCRTLKESRKVCYRLLGFHRFITFQHSTLTPWCSTLTPRFFVSAFWICCRVLSFHRLITDPQSTSA